ncbi:hypothetical protein BGX30_010617, partial [Mortierella sp. GBA39]
ATRMIEDTGTTKTTDATKSEAAETVKAVKSMGDADDPGVTIATVRELDGWCSDCQVNHLPEMSPQGLGYVGVVSPKT